MSDQLFKSIGVTNNMTLRGKPFLVDNRINPVFMNCTEIDALRAEIDGLKKQVQALQTKPTAAAVAPKPAAAAAVAPKPAAAAVAPKPAAAAVAPKPAAAAPKPAVKPVVHNNTPVSK